MGRRFFAYESMPNPVRPVQISNEACLGCMMCESSITVSYETNVDLNDLKELADGLVPVTTARQTDRSECGLSAMNGCKNADGREELVEAINAGVIPGIQIKE